MRRKARTLLRECKGLFSYPELFDENRDQDTYWEKRRGQRLGVLNSFQKFRADWILARVETGDSLLDLGAGDGAMVQYMRHQKDLRIKCADISQVALDYLRSKGFETVELELTDCAALASIEPVDHVVLCEVLEHLVNPEQLLRALEDCAKNSIFFSVPNTGYWSYRLRLLMGRFPVQWIAHPGEHCRFWTYKDMRWWLAELGYGSRSEVRAYEGVPGLNRLMPGLFAKGLIARIKFNTC